MRRVISILLTLVIVLSLCACGTSMEYQTAVTQAKEFSSALDTYYSYNPNSSITEMYAAALALGDIYAEMEELYFDAYLALSPKEQAAFLEWFSSYDYGAYILLQRIISGEEFSTVLP